MSFSSTASALQPGRAPQLEPLASTQMPESAGASSAGGDEFHALVEGPSSDSDDGVMGMLKGVDASRKDAESALIKTVKSGDPSRMYEATATMARYNLQTLVLNKVASKLGQAVDRLTNLQ